MSSTRVGVILGTAAGMAQANGKRVDQRADIWAFGVVLYEMLTGVRPFGAETVSETLAAVFKEDPDWQPIPVARRLRTCLQRQAAPARHWRRGLAAAGESGHAYGASGTRCQLSGGRSLFGNVPGAKNSLFRRLKKVYSVATS
jgi:serine/threonine protein kinase